MHDAKGEVPEYVFIARVMSCMYFMALYFLAICSCAAADCRKVKSAGYFVAFLENESAVGRVFCCHSVIAPQQWETFLFSKTRPRLLLLGPLCLS